MADNLTPEDRRKTMQAVKGKKTKLEKRLFSMLAGMGLEGWKQNESDITGKPDVAFVDQKVAIFVDGCFWHRHKGCKFSYTPKSRTEFWLPKFERNVARDRLVTRTLRKAGWRVVRIWECQLTAKKQARVLHRLRRALMGSAPACRQRARP